MKPLALLLAFSFILAPLTAKADDATALLGKHQAYIGWHPGDGTFSSLAMQGEVTRLKNGTPGTVAHLKEVRKGLAYRDTETSAKYGTNDDSGFTGRVFWETNQNGFTHPVVGDGERYAISSELIFNEGFASLDNPQSKGTQTVNGASCSVVEVKIDASFPIDACIDSSTGALVQAVIDPRGSYETTVHIDSYQTVNGKRIVGSWHYGDSKSTYRWTKIDANATVSDDQLHPPAQTAIWSFASGTSFPIEFEHNDKARGVYITALVNGVRGRFLMDTGASDIVLNRSFTGKLHLKPLFGSMAGGIGGTARLEVQKADTIQVGGNTLSNVIVSTVDYDIFDGKENDEELDGIIGYDLFGGAIVQLDLDTQQMTLYDPAKMQLQDNIGVPLSVDLSSLQPMIPMKVNGSIPVRAILDSGDLMARVTFSYDLANKYGLRMVVDKSVQGITQGIQFASGIGGTSRMECGTLDSLSIGPIVYQAAPACKSMDFSDNWAIVGFDFIQHFNILFDYPEGKLVLMPRNEPQ